ncbi:SsgA family sporulation/cell division regulator [Streptomyces sp. CA-251387]|uniref:SsgA family sporulation/cell division regulator n=1 Tax=Streptomyces sp. CA-251387 TaxID=3240064 RepID=UPI003D91FB14
MARGLPGAALRGDGGGRGRGADGRPGLADDARPAGGHPAGGADPADHGDTTDHLAVHLDFPPHVTLDGEATTWTFARVLLSEGLRAPAGLGRVRVRPCGAAHTYVEFHSPVGTAVLRFVASDLYRFRARTYTVIAPGEETVGAELDQGLVALFGGRV